MIIAGTFIYFLSTPPQNYLYPVLFSGSSRSSAAVCGGRQQLDDLERHRPLALVQLHRPLDGAAAAVAGDRHDDDAHDAAQHDGWPRSLDQQAAGIGDVG
eukprot:COSAG01_NODE_13350_length_1597_cov_1.222964_3_plen_100_part_00